MQNVIIDPKWFFDPAGPHGVAHSKRVMVLSEVLGIMHGCTNQIQILRKAAAYHDIGRVDNSVDVKHGFRSTDKAFLLGVLNPRQNKVDGEAMLLIDEHCLPDSFNDSLLLKILKDADALDRVRFGDQECGLNPRYLRTAEAKKLVGFARVLLVQIPEVVKTLECHSDPRGYVDLSLNDW